MSDQHVWCYLVCVVVCITGTVYSMAEERVSYKGYKVVRITPRTEQELGVLKKVIQNNEDIDVWQPPTVVNRSVDVNLSPKQQNFITGHLDQTFSSRLRSRVWINDVQAMIDDQMSKNAKESAKGKMYGKYRTLDQIYSWMDKMLFKYKGLTTNFVAAKSYEGRKVRGIKIKSDSGKKSKPGFYIQGGIHPREWVSPATVIYIIGQMLSKYGKNRAISKLVDKYTWYIVPVANPDGYKYTWDADRMWRKTRSPNKGSNCIGTDPNRNWDYEWCTTGISTNPCSDIYCGPKAFSESEVEGVANFILEKKAKVFIDIHAYSQLWMNPWGYTKDLPKDYKIQKRAAKKAVEALEAVYGTDYEYGTIANIIYEASGSTADWGYGAANIKFSCGIELRDKGEHGFLLPPELIVPTAKEFFAGLAAYADVAYDNL